MSRIGSRSSRVLHRVGAVALACVAALSTGCTQDHKGGGAQAIRETGYLTCQADVNACGEEVSCTSDDGTSTCVAPPAACDGHLTCACAGDTLCGGLGCLEIAGGIECGEAADAGPVPDVDGFDPAPDARRVEDASTPIPDAANMALVTVAAVPFPAGPPHLTTRHDGSGADTAEFTFQVTIQGEGPVGVLTWSYALAPGSVTDGTLDGDPTPDGQGLLHARFTSGVQGGFVAVEVTGAPGEAWLPRATSERVIVAPEVATLIALRCNDAVMPAFDRRVGAPTIDGVATTECDLTALDRTGSPVVHTAVHFEAEGGTITADATTDEAGIARAFLVPQGTPPVDLPPFAPDPDALTPRDGLIRIIASLAGAENFVDVDGDGQYTELDILRPEDDRGEPYVDNNDNGECDPGEPFADTDRDSLYTTANGVWDSHTTAWADTTVLFVGRVSPERSLVTLSCGNGCATDAPLRADCPPSDFYLAPAGEVTFESVFADDNGNCVGGGFEDTLQIASTEPEVSAALASIPLGDSCFAPDHSPGVQPLSQTLTNLGAQPPFAPELFRVTVSATSAGNDGRTHVETREFTGCR